jgi:hypothetical protein
MDQQECGSSKAGEHRKSRSHAKAVARADKKKQERAQMKRAKMQKDQKQPEEPAAEATTDTVLKTQVWLLEFEVARVRKYADECMKNVATAIKEMTEVTTFQYGMKEQDEVAVVKLHAKMCQGLRSKGIEALTAGAKILACVGETDGGESEELTEWLKLLQG